jgi:hypothetical protein
MSTSTSEIASARVTIRIGPRTWARLVAEARQDRRPVSSMARLLLADALADRNRDRNSDEAESEQEAGHVD